MEYLVQTQNLVKRFGSHTVVDNVSLQVKKGEVLGFLGPNGAGKSTTMRMITGYLEPSAGLVAIDGVDITKEPIKSKARIGYLPEGVPLYPEMTPRQFLKFIGEIRGLKGKELRASVDSAIQKLNLEQVLDQSIETLSKGFKRRVGFAQAILNDPDVLILDEPTDGLDPLQKHEARELIKTMAKDKAIIISTHILEEVEAVCNRVVIIAKGKMVADGTVTELLKKSKHKNLDDYFREMAKEGAEVR